ncbi:prolyl oligopeptidase family serine peptidase [Flavitalea flava]
MKKGSLFFILFHIIFLSETFNGSAQTRFQQKVDTKGKDNPFTAEAVTGYPFPSELTSAATGSRIALAINEKGIRNIYVAEGPSFSLRRLTDYSIDEGQEISGITLSSDGKWVVYVRGGDHGAYDGSTARNPSSSPNAPKVQVISIPFEGGKPNILDNGDHPVIAPNNRQLAFIKNDQVWISPIDGSQTAKQLFFTKGKSRSIAWSPDGYRLSFVANRGDHSLIGVYSDSLSPIQWIAPAFSRDQFPNWSPDGKKLVFIRRPASGGAPDSLTARNKEPWAIWSADVATGSSAVATGKATLLWKAPETVEASAPSTQGGFNLHWTSTGRIVFVSFQDGWPHLYSMPATGGSPLLLTNGPFIAEHIRVSPDGKWLVFSTNTGPKPDDRDRRHIARVSVDKADMEILTQGDGIESIPVITGDDSTLVMISATAQRPGLPALISFQPAGGIPIPLPGGQLIRSDFPLTQLVTPRSVQFTAADGKPVYGQLFEPAYKTDRAGKTLNNTKRPAILFVHGGPERQMLLGWHYGDYYSNTYALNQYLVSQGFIVLSVNYRLGIGYGFDFQNPQNAGMYGASEYQDIKAAGQWLAAQPQVDAKRIGIYGGSYGGFLTALALAHDSRLFAAGVDIHGEHNYLEEGPDPKGEQAPDAGLARERLRVSSAISFLDTWTSPVLLIHGDDDGNVPFHQTLDLVRRFEKKGFPFEQLMIPDETHHWMKYSNMLKVDEAVADFFTRKLTVAPATAPSVETPNKNSSSLSGKIICIDAGHGGTANTDHYRVGPSGEREEWINLRVALALQKLLEEKGATTILTRLTDVVVPLDARAKLALDGKADAFISIHHNATADSAVNFPIIYFHGSASENLAGVALGKLLALSLEKNFYPGKTTLSLNSDYTVFPTDGAAVLRNTYGIPGILAEASFFTNAGEENRLKQEAYNAREASAFLLALEAFFKMPLPPVQPNLIAKQLPPFPVMEEAGRMNPVAREWYRDFLQGAALRNNKDSSLLKQGYALLTRSAGSFPDSYVAGKCQQYRAEILEKLKRPEEAKQERIRAKEFYVEKIN